VLHPYRTGVSGLAGSGGRLPQERLDEAVGLACAIDLDVVIAETVRLTRPRPSTLLGAGAIEDWADRLAESEIELVVIDAALTPVQQRNLERAWQVKVIDRTGLILEIFGERARTREGELQVELAHLEYQRSRLVRSWTHLERQRGGLGFIGGPGETQIEKDRRMIDDRIARLHSRLETVRRTRALHRTQREAAPHAVVALVGYTNAGKSTLFNRLTGATVMSEDMLFATLDPTMRMVEMKGREIILSDTVGFISDLPTQLIAAFRATLEEVLEADLIIHVRDISHPETEQQKADVLGVLAELGVRGDDAGGPPVIEVLNKIDRLHGCAADAVESWAARLPRVVPVSAMTGQGVEALLEVVEEVLGARDRVIDVDVAPDDGRPMSWLHRNGHVLNEYRDERGHCHMRVRLEPAAAGRFSKRYGDVVAIRPAQPDAAG